MGTMPMSMWSPLEHCQVLVFGDWPVLGERPMHSETSS